MTVFGDGSQTRSFCYVSDLVDGLYRLMLSDERYPVNLGNPREMTILEFAEHIRQMTGTQIGNRLPRSAGGRSEAAQARYHQSQDGIGLGAARSAGRRPARDGCVLPGTYRGAGVTLGISPTIIPELLPGR